MRSMLLAVTAALILGAPAAAQDQTIYKPGEGVKSPVLTHEVKPNYTESAMRRRVEGVVEMETVVKTDGTVGDVSITRSLDSELDDEAIKALRQWTFKPGTKDGQPVNVRVNVEMTFTLRKK